MSGRPSMADWLNRTLFVPVAAVRPYLALKGTLLLLALDLWLTRAEHGGRYGAGGFNVAHWSWLDALQPVPTPALYVGLCTFTGALCFVLAVASRPPRWLIAIAFLLSTWSWAMSMLDSYQHHYLLSIVLFAMMFFPRLDAERALLASEPERAPPDDDAAPPADGARVKKRKKSTAQKASTQRKVTAPKKANATTPSRSVFDAAPLTSAWAYVLLAASIAIVYAYTAYSKSDPEWLTGAALRQTLSLPDSGLPVGGAIDRVGPIRAIASMVGVEGETFWWAMGHSVVAVQIICCVGYLLAPFRDVTQAFALRALSWIALFTALSFHLGAEYMDLKIGWFSWYMVGYALVFFLPGRWLAVLARVALPLSGARFGAEVLAVRLALGLGLVMVGAMAEQWTGAEVLGISLGQLFGQGYPVGGGEGDAATLVNLPMIMLGVVLLLVTPVRLVAHAAHADTEAHRNMAIGAAAVGAGALAGVGYLVDLPGAFAATILGGVALGAGVVGLMVQRGEARGIHGYAVGAFFAALTLLASISGAEVRWDFYRNIGGDYRRRGEIRASYEAYVKANEYAPEGQDRRRQEDEMRQRLEALGEQP